MDDLGVGHGVAVGAELERLEDPILVSASNGAGHKAHLASKLRRFDSVGVSVVNRCVNDLLVQGAKPLFATDSFSTGTIYPDMTQRLIGGCVEACKTLGIPLIGGDIQEMPFDFLPTRFNLNVTTVGVVSNSCRVTGSDIAEGDVVLGLPSSGLHSHGNAIYILTRCLFSFNANFFLG